MSRTVVLYLVSLMLRSSGVAILAGICAWRMKSVARRHAVWVAVLGIMIFMPVADRIVPSTGLFAPLSRTVPSVLSFDSGSPAASTIGHAPVNDPAPFQLAHWNGWRMTAIAYGVVTLLLSIQIVLAHVKLRQIKRKSSAISTRECDLSRAGLCESEAVSIPMTIGWLKPVVILPSDWKSWDEWKLRAVLTHELAHVRRGDWAVALLGAVNTVLFWYNPLSWWLERRLAVLCEEASDEASISVVGDPARYCEVLLQFASTQVGARLRICSLAMARRNITSRIERILAVHSAGSGFLTRAAWLMVLGLAVPLLYTAAAVHTARAPAMLSKQVPAASVAFDAASIKLSRLGEQLVYARCHGRDGDVWLGIRTMLGPVGYV